MPKQLKDKISLKRASALVGLVVLTIFALSAPISAHTAEYEHEASGVEHVLSENEYRQYYNLESESEPSSFDNSGFLHTKAEEIAGMPVGESRVFIATVLFVFASMISLVLLVIGIRTSITSVHRSPLAKKSVKKNMLRIFFTSIFIFLLGVSGVYLLLRL